jgi:hypothetical protein
LEVENPVQIGPSVRPQELVDCSDSKLKRTLPTPIAVVLMLRQMQCCQLCLRPRHCAAAAPAVSTGTIHTAHQRREMISERPVNG